MRKIVAVSVLVLLFFSGCSQEAETVHKLDCILNGVIYNKTGKVVSFTREDAIKNGYEYYFRIQNDGTLIVNDADIYIKDIGIEKSYSLQRETKVDKNMKFTFNEAFDDVRFLIVNKEIEYSYTCSQEKQ
ncbi:hypothetical protein [Sulfurovum sp.]|uniref:hypothetical protein n=1 Tax=Sulfurovum sp. TaxID=1969726 RepID=UPI003562FAD3